MLPWNLPQEDRKNTHSCKALPVLPILVNFARRNYLPRSIDKEENIVSTTNFLNTDFQTNFALLSILINQMFQAITFLSCVHKIPHSNPDRKSFYSDVFHACSQYIERSVCILRHNRPRTIISISFQFSVFQSSHRSKLYSEMLTVYFNKPRRVNNTVSLILGKKIHMQCKSRLYIRDFFYFPKHTLDFSFFIKPSSDSDTEI